MKKILYCESCEDGSTGGSHQLLFDNIRLLNPAKYQATVVFYEENRFVQPLRDLGVTVHVWSDIRRKERGTDKILSRLRRIPDALQAIARRRRLLKSEGIDLIHLNNSPHYGHDDWLPAAMSLGLPCVVTIMGGPYSLPKSRLKRFLATRFDQYICISGHVYDELLQAGFPRDRLVHTTIGIDLDAFRNRVRRTPTEVRSELSIDPSKMLVAMIGNLQPWKGHSVVVSAMERMPIEERSQICILFVGTVRAEDEEHATALRKRVFEAAMEESIRFLGYRLDVPDLIHAADLQLHASTFPEPFGLVVIEGLCLGTPLIAASSGGPKEILTPETGTLFDPTDPDQLKEALRTHLKFPEIARKMSAAGPERAELFSAQKMADDHEQIYRELIREPNSTNLST